MTRGINAPSGDGALPIPPQSHSRSGIPHHRREIHVNKLRIVQRRFNYRNVSGFHSAGFEAVQ